ncbi:MAG: TonB-dependent receptor [Rikenellaceae bacterium]
MKWLLIILSSLIALESTFAMGEDPLFIVNGKEVSKSAFEKIEPAIITKMQVLKEYESTKEYGTRGDHGVILVTLLYDTSPIFADDKNFVEYLKGNIKWDENEYPASAFLKYRLKTDGTTELIEIDCTDRRFKKRVLKAFNSAPRWKSPTMNMGEAVEIEGSVRITLPNSKNIMIR